MARKRAPGGGRKPSPLTPTAQLTVRMPDDLRGELEAAAHKRGGGRTLTDEVVARLRSSLSRERDDERDPALRALNFVVSQLAERVSGGSLLADRGLRSEAQKKWRTDPFLFRAFKFAVGKLLDALEPPKRESALSEAELAAIKERALKETAKEAAEKFGYTPEMEKWFIEIHKTPEAYGANEFGMLWTQLTRTNPLTDQEQEMARRYPRFGNVIEREFYGFNNARRDLGIDEPGEPKS